MERYDVRPSDPDLRCGDLSGGNRQKPRGGAGAVRGSEGPAGGASRRAGSTSGRSRSSTLGFSRSATSGCAILLVSVELDEILALSDRILVMNAGRIVGEAARGEADAHRIGLMMAGVGGVGDAAWVLAD